MIWWNDFLIPCLECGLPLEVLDHTIQAPGRARNLEQCQYTRSYILSPHQLNHQSGLTPMNKWLIKEKYIPLSLSQKLKPGLSWQKTYLEQAAVSSIMVLGWNDQQRFLPVPQQWNRDDKSVTDYTPLHPCKISCAACRVDVLAWIFKGF